MAKKRKNEERPPIKFGEKVIPRAMDEVMHTSMLPYAEHVILERALPRVEDGLKPVQRRILYTMLTLGLMPDKPHKKSARIVGECLGKYHPHGDQAVYDAMVRMAQGFNMRIPLVGGHGNFGSIDGDPAAAIRYTEARMTEPALVLLRDLDKETVDFRLNFDDTTKEPDLMPARFPNLLVNGASGIAVGLATNIPPHNPTEAINAVIKLLDAPDTTLDELMKIIPCPDFPTGGYIIDSPEIRLAYETGRGKITMRAKTAIEQMKNGRQLIVIDEVPYQVNKAKMLEDILKVTQSKKALFFGVTAIRDESDRFGLRAVIELKKDADAEKTLQYLFKYSDLQMTFGVNMVAIADGKPQQMGLKAILRYYLKHQRDVVTRRTKFDLDAALSRAHILDGLSIAVLNIDEVIALIRASKTPKIAREGLMTRFKLTEAQAQAILDLRLQRLTNLELLGIENEAKEIRKRIKELQAIIDSPKRLDEVVRAELIEAREKLSDDRRTVLLPPQEEIVVAQSELVVVEDVMVAVLKDEKLRRIPKRLYNFEQLLPEKPIAIFDTSTEKRIKLFTNKGSCFTVEVGDIIETRVGSRAVNLNTMVALDEDERIVTALDEYDNGSLLFFTKSGNVKRSDAKEYITRVKKVQAISLKDNDEVLCVQLLCEENLLLISKQGMSIRFAADTVPETGRVSAGVKCMKLEDNDAVLFAMQLGDDGEIITVSDRGYAKRSFVFDYELQGRNGKGLKTFDFKKNGSNGTCIAGALHVKEPYDIIVEQRHGSITKLNTEEIAIEQRAGKGTLTVMALLDDVVTGVYKA